MTSAPAARLLALLLLALEGRAIMLVAQPQGTLSFRSIAVPIRRYLSVPHALVSDVPADHALGTLLAYVPRKPKTGELLVFLPGSGQPCDEYSQLMETVARHIRAICLPYDNIKAIGMLCKMNNGCYPDLRLEAFNGTFGGVSGNNIEDRLASTLVYLSRRDSGAWSTYLAASSNLPLWNRVRLAGHSQGAGHAAFIGYHRELARVVQFSGVCDRSNWTAQLGPPRTPPERFFGLASSWDTLLCPASMAQVRSWLAEGALPPSAAPLRIRSQDNVTSVELGGSHFVLSNIVPPNCSMVQMVANAPRCDYRAHESTAMNTWTANPPYAQGLWQDLCGVGAA